MDGNRLKSLRELRGFTQDELADEVRTSIRNISRWENGGSDPSNEMVSLLAKALKTSTDYLLSITDDPTPINYAYSENLHPYELKILAALRRGDYIGAIRLITDRAIKIIP